MMNVAARADLNDEWRMGDSIFVTWQTWFLAL